MQFCGVSVVSHDIYENNTHDILTNIFAFKGRAALWIAMANDLTINSVTLYTI